MTDENIRTIDLHTSEQIHQMHGKFDNALNTSLSNHGAHEEALRRIEHYSITSLRSSAHSIKSMDSIRTELSRLEAMITVSQTTSTSRLEQTSEDPIMESSRGRSRHLPHENNATFGTGDLIMPSSFSTSGKGSSGTSKYSSKASSFIPARTHRNIDARTHPAEFQKLVEEQEDISKRFSEISDGHESALLYAQFARDTSPKEASNTNKPDREGQEDHPSDDRNKDRSSSQDGAKEDFKSAAIPIDVEMSNIGSISISQQRLHDTTEGKSVSLSRSQSTPLGRIDPVTTFGLIHQCMEAVYSPIVAQHVTLQNLSALCEGHIRLLEDPQSALVANAVQQASNHKTAVQPHIRRLRNHLEVLQNVVDVSSASCIDAGYSLSDLDKVVPPIGQYRPAQDGMRSHGETESRSHINQPPATGLDDTASDDSDAYFSSTE